VRRTKPIWGVLGAEVGRRGVDAGRIAGAPVAPNATNLGAFSPKDDTRPEARKMPTEKAYLIARIWCVRQTLRVTEAPAAPNEANMRRFDAENAGAVTKRTQSARFGGGFEMLEPNAYVNPTDRRAVHALRIAGWPTAPNEANMWRFGVENAGGVRKRTQSAWLLGGRFQMLGSNAYVSAVDRRAVQAPRVAGRAAAPNEANMRASWAKSGNEPRKRSQCAIRADASRVDESARLTGRPGVGSMRVFMERLESTT